MKAAVLYQINEPLQIEDGIEIPKLEPGQVLVQLAYSGVCHSQLMEVRGKRGADSYLPHLLGHEGTGVVVETGSKVRKVKSGQKVILGWIRSAGLDSPGVRYKKGNTIINAGGVTTFNEFAVVAENRCVLLPDKMPMDVAVLLGCAALTGAGIVLNSLIPKEDSTIAVYGLGGIGLSALMAASFFHPSKLIAVDVNDEKLKLAADLGATHTIHSRREDPIAKIRDLTHGKGVDYAIEAAGLSQTIEMAFNSVRRGGGKCVFASHPEFGSKIAIDPYEMICGKELVGSWGGASIPDRDVPRLCEAFFLGKFPLNRLLNRYYRLEEINQALEDLESHRVLRPLILLDSGVGRVQ